MQYKKGRVMLIRRNGIHRNQVHNTILYLHAHRARKCSISLQKNHEKSPPDYPACEADRTASQQYSPAARQWDQSTFKCLIVAIPDLHSVRALFSIAI